MTEKMVIDCETVKRRLDAGDDFLLLDCREADEFETAQIDGAQRLPMSQLQERLGELDDHRDREVIVYCHHGVRSLRVAHWLRENGFRHAVSMAGGIDEWSQQIDPSVPRY